MDDARLEGSGMKSEAEIWREERLRVAAGRRPAVWPYPLALGLMALAAGAFIMWTL